MKTYDRSIDAPEREAIFAEEDAVMAGNYAIIVLRKEGAYTLEEYFALEADSEIRHEFHNGELYQMPGAKPAHEIIVAALAAALFSPVRKQGGYVFTSNLKIEMPGSKRFYPDLGIVRGTPEYGGKNGTTLLNPTILIEVLSDSTAHYDMGEKFTHYRALSSLREYLLFDQETAWILHYRLNERGRWEIIEHDGNAVVLESIDYALTIRDVYGHLA